MKQIYIYLLSMSYFLFAESGGAGNNQDPIISCYIDSNGKPVNCYYTDNLEPISSSDQLLIDLREINFAVVGFDY